MFHAWVALEALLLLYGIANGVELEKMASLLWDEEVQSLFAAIVGFWFGNRMLVRGNQEMAATLAVTQPVNKAAASAIVKNAAARIPDPPGSRT